jgi:cytochrome c oxidase assembly protein subunit 15
LLLALTIMAACIWVALDLRQVAKTDENRPARLTGASALVLGALFLQLLFGAWVAGLDAGQVANDWPTMQGRIVPDGIDWSRGALHAFTNDPFLIHFVHRWWAWVVVAVLVLFARKIRTLEDGRKVSIAIHIAFGTQVILGIFTVLSGIAIWLAALHQAVGASLVAATIWGVHVAGRRGR